MPGEEEEFVRIISERPTALIKVKQVNPRSHEEIAWVKEMLEKAGKTQAAADAELETTEETTDDSE